MVKTPERIGEEADLPARRLAGLALNPSTPQDVRQRIAYRADLGPAERRALAVDPDPKVRLAVSVHPALSEEERAAIDYEVPTDCGFHLDHEELAHPAAANPARRGPRRSRHARPEPSPGRTSRPPDWPPTPTTRTPRTPRSGPWPCATPRPRRPSWNVSPRTRTRPCGPRRPATRTSRGPG
ncbi:hypothetical protein ABT255_56845 [Streptomyces mirabilis]|uniref:hypothetical protein n=1 Tax=Streptomyces mirabilis TaxID=68239 RepID=UPI00332EFA31